MLNGTRITVYFLFSFVAESSFAKSVGEVDLSKVQVPCCRRVDNHPDLDLLNIKPYLIQDPVLNNLCI